MSNKQNEVYEENKKEFLEEKECPTCGTLKVSNPTPDGDEICPSCGELEMMDKEEKDPALNGLRDAKDLEEGEFDPLYNDGSEESKQALKKVKEQEKNNFFK
jgi:uncharacterized Zn finger protein (UPF0148 family)